MRDPIPGMGPVRSAGLPAPRIAYRKSENSRRLIEWHVERASESMRAAGATVEQHVYDGEGHGFSKAATIVDSFERMERFLSRWVLQR